MKSQGQSATLSHSEGTLASDGKPQEGKSQEEVQKEIQAIIRQITASITFLPVLDAGQCTFNVQVYADADALVPTEWADSAAKEVKNAEKVQLRSFSTDTHEIGTLVAYRLGDDDA